MTDEPHEPLEPLESMRLKNGMTVAESRMRVASALGRITARNAPGVMDLDSRPSRRSGKKLGEAPVVDLDARRSRQKEADEKPST